MKIKINSKTFRVFIAKNKSFFVSSLILFLVLILVMPPNRWNGNEETYLGYAWKTVNPNNIPQFSALTDEANHRFAFDFIFGFLANTIGFEWTHALGRIWVAFLYSIAITTLFKAFRLSTAATCTIILLFVWLGEDILGGESLFNGVEAKTLAYPFVILSFFFALRLKFTYTYILLAIATYFHFLVGGFWFLVTAIVQWYNTSNLKKTATDVTKYIVICFPLILLIIHSQLSSTVPEDYQGPSVGWIYSYFRHPHHVAPFASFSLFKRKWYDEIIFLLGLTASLVIFHQSVQGTFKKISKLLIGLYGYLIVGLPIYFLDKQGSLGKFYLFRPSSLILLFTIVLFGLFLKEKLGSNAKFLNLITLILVSALIIPNSASNYILAKNLPSVVSGSQPIYTLLFLPNLNTLFSTSPKEPTTELDKLILSSKKDEITLIDPVLEGSHLDFERKYHRPTLIYLKFAPTTKEGIIQWYDLIQQREELWQKGCPASLINDYPVRYLLASKDNKAVDNCGQMIYQDQELKLIDIAEQEEVVK